MIQALALSQKEKNPCDEGPMLETLANALSNLNPSPNPNLNPKPNPVRKCISARNIRLYYLHWQYTR